RWIDIPAAVFCFSPALTSVVNEINGSGWYDGMSVALTQVVTWGLPYLIGRAYFDDIDGLKELAIGIFIGGIIYMPLCWFEMRMSPQLHNLFYGFHQHDFRQTIRFGGYRPMVFMQHGLMVGMWMAMTTLIGLWLWRSGTIERMFDLPLGVLVALLAVTAVACRSTYASFLLLLGCFTLFSARWLRTKWLIVGLLAIPPLFMFVRGTGMVDGMGAVELSKQIFGDERGGSLETRVVAENALSEKARERPWFGWGGWERSRVSDENGVPYITDSLWIITFGTAGIVNLAALTIMLLMPMILIMKDYRVEFWSHPMIAPAVVLATICMLYMFDHLMNGMVNPIFMLAVGGVCSAHFKLPSRLPAPELYRAMQQRGMRAMPTQPAYAMRGHS
ncbi:MAG TPA: hypothetical protein VF669_12195, partial [Tepidisphaeraceae bacterium]